MTKKHWVKTGKKVDCLETGKAYYWVGPKERPGSWNGVGNMDFMLDGEVHECTGWDGISGAFSDSPDPSKHWSWKRGFEHLRLAEEAEYIRPDMSDWPDWLKDGPVLCKVWDDSEEDCEEDFVCGCLPHGPYYYSGLKCEWNQAEPIIKVKQTHTITIDGKEIKLSEESYKELKRLLQSSLSIHLI